MDKNIGNLEKFASPFSAENPFIFPFNFSVKIPLEKTIIYWETLIKTIGNS